MSVSAQQGTAAARDGASVAIAPGDSATVWILLDRGLAVQADPATDAGDPPPVEFLAGIRDAGARIRVVSRWLHAVSAWVDAGAAARVAALPFVVGLRPVGELRAGGVDRSASGSDGGATGIRTQEPDGATTQRSALTAPTEAARIGVTARPPLSDADYGAALTPLGALRVPAAHALGFTGRGVRIAILDTGFNPAHESVAPLTVVAKRNFIDGDTAVADRFGEPPGGAEHGTAVWSLLSAYRPGRLVGPAFDAEFVLAKVNDIHSETRVDEDRWIAALEWAVDSLGTDLVISALGFREFDDASYQFSDLDGRTAASSLAALEATRRGALVVAAVGNLGPAFGTLVAPADADSILAVGAVDTLHRPASFSSQGPTADGRLKPELVAIGDALTVASAAGETGYRTMNGTDAATPLVGGIAAMFLEAWPGSRPADVRTALLLSGHHAHAAANDVGHGMPDILSAILFPDGLELLPLSGTGADGALGTLSPTFAWHPHRVHGAAGAVHYRLQIAADSQFSTIVHTDSVTAAAEIALDRPLRATPELWWRIVAVTELGVERVARRQGPFSIPRWVRLLSFNPTEGIYVPNTRPELRWAALAAEPPIGPLRYDVQVLSAQNRTVVQEVRGLASTSMTVPRPLAYNHPYVWRVIARSRLGVADTVESVAPFVVTSRTQPPVTVLHQNYPNPFPRPDLGVEETRVWFDLSERTTVELTVHDLRGRLVRRLVPAPGCGRVELAAGLYGREGSEGDNPCVLTRWNGRDEDGRLVPRGVYLLRLRTDGFADTRRILFVPEPG